MKFTLETDALFEYVKRQDIGIKEGLYQEVNEKENLYESVAS